jgi:hypothetical protein
LLSDDNAFHLLLVAYQQFSIDKGKRCPVISRLEQIGINQGFEARKRHQDHPANGGFVDADRCVEKR